MEAWRRIAAVLNQKGEVLDKSSTCGFNMHVHDIYYNSNSLRSQMSVTRFRVDPMVDPHSNVV